MALWSVKLNPILLHCSAHSHFTLSTNFNHRLSSSKARSIALSSHSNAQILKHYDPMRYLYDFHEDDEDEDDDESDEYYWPSEPEDESAELDELDINRKTNKAAKGMKKKQGKKRKTEKVVSKSLQSKRSLNFNENCLNVGSKRQILETNIGKLSTATDKPNIRARECMQHRYPRMFEEVDMDAKWIPLLDYLSSFGLKESHFIQMCERHMLSLKTNVDSAQERLDYLMSVGVKQRDIKRILLRQPQILAYTVESNLKPHVNFLAELGIPSSSIGKIVVNAPSLFSYSVESSLKPTVRYLIEEVGIKENCLGKVVRLSPQILVQRIDITWNTRLLFLSEELGAPRDSILKMVTQHPQFLHYSIHNGLLPRINFLRSIGMCNSDILKVLTGLTQVLSLSLEDNLKPKCLYLVNELKNDVQSLTKYPTYFSLSLDQRIRPRHRFLVSLNKAPKGPFPLSSFVPTDESFCQQCAGTSLDRYLEFRQSLLLQQFAKKYEKR